VPLQEVLSELVSSGPSSKTVGRHYDRLLNALGPELSILCDVPVDDIARSASPVIAEAVSRLRAGEVTREAGYDGEYGVIRLFEEAELQELTADSLLFGERMTRNRASSPLAARTTAGR
jgi:PHP family Zn ribbon phosphoesterase